MNAPRPEVRLLVNHRDVTGDFSPWLLSLSYVDHLAGEADGLEISLDNSEGRWLQGWYPVKGSTLEAWLGYEGQPLMPCGEFQVDEMDFSGPPDVVNLRALAAGARTPLRTRQTQVWEGVSLRQVVKAVADRHGLQVAGAVPDLHWRCVTQMRETDLGFLQRLAIDLGVVFTIKGQRLVFHDLETLEAAPAVRVVRRDEVIGWSFRDKVVEGAASASYFDGETGELQVVELQAAHGDHAKRTRRAESRTHATRLAKVALRVARSQEREGTLALSGNVVLRAGRTLELQGWGVLDGLWLIKSARHSVDRGGYRVDLEVRHVV